VLVAAHEIGRDAPSVVSGKDASRSGGVSFPLISTSGGLPGVKKRSLIFDEVFSIAASSAGVENGAGAGAAAAAAALAGRGAEEARFGAPFVGEDIEKVPPFG
jgi:hypothetical protein